MLQDFLAAVGLLTIMPVPAETTASRPRRAAAGFYPWVGWLLGIDVVLLLWLLHVLNADIQGAQFVGATLVLVYWGVATGGMHLDGLSDTFDGIGCRGDRERKLEVMCDPRIGGIGAIAILIVVIAQLSAVSRIVQSGALWPLIAAPVLGRATASIFTWSHKPAKEEGLGKETSSGFAPYPVAAGALAVTAVIALPWIAEGLRGLGVDGMPVAGVLCADIWSLVRVMGAWAVSALVVPRALGRIVGGVTGDLLGASIVLTEAIVLLVAALWR